MAITDFAPHNMTSNVLPTPYVASASSEYDASWGAFCAFNKDISDAHWIAAPPFAPGWVKIFIYDPIVLHSYNLQAALDNYPTSVPRSFELHGSVDDTTWITLDTRTNETSWGNGEIRNYICNSPSATPFSYFKLYVSDNNGDVDWLEVGELYLNVLSAANYLHARRDRLNMRGISIQNNLA